jgi:copper chaperone CopZ
MKTLANVTLAASLVLGIASTSWAGGSACSEGGKASSTSAASGSHCTRGADASMASGSHCSGMGAHATAASECHVGANQVMYSFAVPTAECSTCVNAIQKAAIAQKGVSCAHVDLSTRTAYIIADKKVNERDLSRAIADAGYKNKFTAEGSKAQASFTKAFASGDKSVNCCSKNKDRA